MASFSAQANTGLNLASKTALVVGGTQGIGAGIALRLAQAGASVSIVGRSESKAQQLLQRLEQSGQTSAAAASKPRYDFISADLSQVKGIKDFVSEVQSRGSVDYLFQCQGSPPVLSYVENADGIEQRFAIMLLSKFAILKGLAEGGQLKESALAVCATASGKEDLNPQDPSFKQDGFGFLASAARDGLVMDALTLSLLEKHPSLRFFHAFPGIVSPTGGARNFPFPLPQLAALAAPVIANTVGNSPESYANIPVFAAANKDSEQKLTTPFIGPTLSCREASKWATVQSNRDQLWQAMSDMLA